MKVRITESRPGELQERAEDVVRVVEKLAGRSLLKAAPEPDQQIKQTPAQFEYPAQAGSVKRARREVKRIQALMDAKIAAVLSE